MFTKKAIEKITAVIPDYLIQEREGGGGKKLSYISGSTVIDILNTAFDYMWDWKVESAFIQESQPKFNQYAKVPEDQKVVYNGKKGAWEPQSPIAHVRGTLTVWVEHNGELFAVKKEGFGSKVIMGGASEQESIFKAASTDALKKAASLLGIGAQLYRNENEAYYFYNELNYEDPWTDEMKEELKEYREFIVEFMGANQMSEEQFLQYVQSLGFEAIEYMEYILPDNIKEIVDAIKSDAGNGDE